MKSIAVLISEHGPDEGQSPAEQCNVLCRKIRYFVFSIVKKCAALSLPPLTPKPRKSFLEKIV